MPSDKVKAALLAIAEFCDQLSTELVELGREDLALSLKQKISEINKDGRSSAWTEARKLAHSSKVRKSVSLRNDLKAETSVLIYEYRFIDERPTSIRTLEDLSSKCGLAISTIRSKLSLNPDGFIIRSRISRVVYATSPDAFSRLCVSEFKESGDIDDVVHLPKKKANRF